MAWVDLIGKKFGRLTVLRRDEKKNMGKVFLLCRCDCGNECSVRADHLKSGETQSCGCLHAEIIKRVKTVHGMAGKRLQVIWNNMKARCYNPKSQHYNRYGGRGISICPEWVNDCSKFITWALNNGYSDDLTIDRINNDGNYEPQNCRWVTQQEQAQNTSQNVRVRCIETGKQYRSISEAAADNGIHPNSITNALYGRTRTAGRKHWELVDEIAACCVESFQNRGDQSSRIDNYTR